MNTKELKDKILQLAITGKLVEQDENDIPASELLKKIRTEKEELIKEKKIKKEKLLSNISEEEKPFELPKGWEWTRLNDITHSLTLNDGDWIVSSDMDDKGEIKLIQLGSIGDGIYLDKGFKRINEVTFNKLNCRELFTGDILINRLIGKKMMTCRLPDIEGKKITSVDTCFIRENNKIYDSDYLIYTILSPYFQAEIYKFLGGTTRQRISKGNLIKVLLPLPPLEEQKRIVEKVEQLFSLIDELEGNKQDLLEGIKKSREKVLQLAIEGKLVEQNENDTPASILLQEIKEEKERLIKEKKIKKEKVLPEINEEEKYFEIPKGWEWCRLGEIGQIIGGGTPSTSNKEFYSEKEIAWLTPADLSLYKKKYIEHGKKYISKLGLEKSSAKILPVGSVLFSSRAPIGYIAINSKEVCTNQGFKSVAPFKLEINEYIYYYLKFYTEEIIKIATGTTFKEVSGGTVSKLVCPLPPLEEQKRIVAKVEELMEYFDALENQICS